MVSVVWILQPFQEYLGLILSEFVNELGFNVQQQQGHIERGPRFKVISERPEKRGIDLTTAGLVVQRVFRYTTAAPGCFLCFMQSGPKSGVPREKQVLFSLQMCSSSKTRIHNGDNDHQPRNHFPGSPALILVCFAYQPL